MPHRRLCPARAVRGAARPNEEVGGCGGWGLKTTKQRTQTGAWGGQPPPLTFGLRSVATPPHSLSGILVLLGWISWQAGTYPTPSVPGLYLYLRIRLTASRFHQWLITKVLGVIGTIMGFHYRLGHEMIRVKGGIDYGRDNSSFGAKVLHRLPVLALAQSGIRQTACVSGVLAREGE